MNRLLVILALIIFCGCNTGQEKNRIVTIEKKLLDPIPGQSPYLTKDGKGNTIVSWVRIINDTSAVFCYAVSADGKTFSDPVVIPNSSNIQAHSENLPKMIVKPSGEIIALWGKANPDPRNTYSGLVLYTQSFNDGKSWTDPKPLTSDSTSYDQRYYDVALLSNGEVAIIWLDNRKSSLAEGSGLHFAATEGKTGFKNERLISQPCCQCCRTDLFVDRSGGIHALYRGIFQDSIRDMMHIVSMDGGKTFSPPKRINNDNWVINGCPHTGPAMTENNKGLHFAWFTGGKNPGCFYSGSVDNGNNYINHERISAFGSHPQITADSSERVLITWDETFTSGNLPFKRIGIQQRNNTGKTIFTQYITPENSTAVYPVIAGVNNKNYLVAYTIKDGNKPHVAYQTLHLDGND